MDYVLGDVNRDLLIIILAAIILGFIMHVNQNRIGGEMDKKTSLIFRLKCLIMKCKERGKFLLAIKLKDILKKL
tara:strand:- start:1575 stop:1796 length:222 start_codon:yes stop_codon:yes gene_type:complete